jgi:hypothetical protein
MLSSPIDVLTQNGSADNKKNCQKEKWRILLKVQVLSQIKRNVPELFKD